MPHDRKSVDALLAAAVSRILNAGYALNRMRELHRQQLDIDYWRAAVDLGEHLTIAGGAIAEAHRLMLADVPLFIPEKGGLPN